MNGKSNNPSSAKTEKELLNEALLAHKELCMQFKSNLKRSGKSGIFKGWLSWKYELRESPGIGYRGIRAVKNTICISSLPDELLGLRILQLSNPQLDVHDDILKSFYSKVGSLKYDLCVVTGGVGLGSDNDLFLRSRAKRFVEALKAPTFIVMGMGDAARSSKILKNLGVEVLNNEFAKLTLVDREIEIFGVECASALIDPRFEGRLGSCKLSDFRVLVSANPQLRVSAANSEFDLMLTGVQSCSNCVVRPVCRWDRQARQNPKVAKNWKCESLKGYTSRGLRRNSGVNSSCDQPELMIHEITNDSYFGKIL